MVEFHYVSGIFFIRQRWNYFSVVKAGSLLHSIGVKLFAGSCTKFNQAKT